MKKGYTLDEIFAVIFESERERKHRRMQAIVIETVAAHRLNKMKELLTFEKLATWRRMDGFDRIAADDNLWASRQLPLTPEQFTQNVWSEVNALKDAISMPAEDTMTRPWQKTIDFVDGLKGNLPDEELAVIKRYVEKRSRETAQAQVTVTPVDTVQRSSPCPLDPEPSPDVCVSLENNEGRMDPELEELVSPSAGTGLETPGQQCHPNERTWEIGRTTAASFLTAAVDSNQGGRIASPAESVDTRADKSTRISADSTFLRQGHKPRSEVNKQFDLGGKGEKAPPCNAAVALLSFSGESWVAPCLFSVCASCSVLCVCSVFHFFFFFLGNHFSAKLKDMRGDADKSLMYTTGGQAFSRLPPLLKMAKTSNARFGRSANALG